MSRHRDEVWLRHMLEHAQTAMKLAANRRREDLEADEILRYALIHLICVTGEAGVRVSDHTKHLYPEMPWNAAKGMRNWLIHRYDVVDLNVVWDTIAVDFPQMVTILERIVSELEKEQ